MKILHCITGEEVCCIIDPNSINVNEEGGWWDSGVKNVGLAKLKPLNKKQAASWGRFLGVDALVIAGVAHWHTIPHLRSNLIWESYTTVRILRALWDNPSSRWPNHHLIQDHLESIRETAWKQSQTFSFCWDALSLKALQQQLPGFF